MILTHTNTKTNTLTNTNTNCFQNVSFQWDHPSHPFWTSSHSHPTRRCSVKLHKFIFESSYESTWHFLLPLSSFALFEQMCCKTFTSNLISSASKQFCRLEVILFFRLSIDRLTFKANEKKKQIRIRSQISPRCTSALFSSPSARQEGSSQTDQVLGRYQRVCRARGNRLAAISELCGCLPEHLLVSGASAETLPWHRNWYLSGIEVMIFVIQMFSRLSRRHLMTLA